jgi:hypothetical protein
VHTPHHTTTTDKEEALLPDAKEDLDIIVAEARSTSSGLKRPRPLGLLRSASSATITSSNNGDAAGAGGGSSSALEQQLQQQQQTGVVPIPPPSFTLTAGPWLSQRAVPALLEVCGFVRVHSKPLNLTPFPLAHLLAALTASAQTATPDGAVSMELDGSGAGGNSSSSSSSSSSSLLQREFSEVPGPLPAPAHGRKGSGSKAPAPVGAPPPFFLGRCCLALLRLALQRHAATGEQVVDGDAEEGPPQPPAAVRIRGFGGDKDVVRDMEVYLWSLVRYGWGELLNPLTLPELLRRYLGWRARERRLALRGKETVEAWSEEGTGFCPFGESFDGIDALVAEGAEALGSQEPGLGALAPEGMLAMLRSLCEDAQELRAVQDFVALKVEVRVCVCVCVCLEGGCGC